VGGWVVGLIDNITTSASAKLRLKLGELGNFPKAIYKPVLYNDIEKNFACWGSMLKAYLYALYSIFLAHS